MQVRRELSTTGTRRTSLVVAAVLIPLLGFLVQTIWMLMSAMGTDSCSSQRVGGPALCSGDLLFWVMWTPAIGVGAALVVLFYGYGRGSQGAPWAGAAWATWCLSLLVAFLLLGVGMA